MKASTTSPYDVTSEGLPEAYLVTFGDTSDGSVSADEWRLDEAESVREVLAWADENSAGRIAEVMVVIRDPSPGLFAVRIAGSNPTEH